MAGVGFAIDASVIKADASRAARWTEGEALTRAMRERLQALDAVNPATDDETPKGPPGSPPRHISPTDPEARWTAAAGGPAFYAYSANYLIDLEAGVVDVEATPAHKTDEVESTKTMIAAADSLEAEAAPGRHRGRGGAAAELDRQREAHRAPHPGALKQRFCPNTPHRKIPRSVYEDTRDVARTVCASPAYEQSRKDRKTVEILFAHLKRILKLDRLRLRGLKGTRDEFLMAAAAQNLRRMAKWLAPKREIEEAIAV